MAGQGGRRSKGNRTQFTVRVPEDHGERYKASADAAGFTHVNDYLAYMLAKVHGLTFTGWAADQQRLPLDTGLEDAGSAARGSTAA